MNSSQLFDFILAEFDIACESKSKSQQLLLLDYRHSAGSASGIRA